MNKFSQAWMRTSVNISPEFYRACKKNGIRFSEALRVGISILLAEKGVIDYNNKLSVVRARDEFKRKAAYYAQKLADLENKSSIGNVGEESSIGNKVP